MTIDRTVNDNGAIFDKVKLTTDEISTLDHCHEILRKRFEERGEPYTDDHRERCEWWLEGLLRFDGIEKMVEAAQNAPFPKKKKVIYVGYASVAKS